MLQDVAQVVVGVRVGGRQLDRAADQGLGLGAPSELERHHTAEMPGVGIVGSGREDAPVELVGGLESSLLLQLSGVRHRVREPELLRYARAGCSRGAGVVGGGHGVILVDSRKAPRAILLTLRPDRASLAWGQGSPGN